MPYCETCGVNVQRRRLRECALNGHKIVWGYKKPDAPTEKMTLKEKAKLEEMKRISKRLWEILPKEKQEEIQRMAKEVLKDLEVILNEKMERGYDNQRV